MNREKLEAQLIIDEGRRSKIYTDTVGKITGGVGRNLSDRPFNDDEISLMLKNDIDLAARELDRVAPWWRNLNDARQNVMANMMFNLGANRLLGFKKFLIYSQSGRFDAAAGEMLDSMWAKQVGARAQRLADLMRKGEF
jgi:lysozyme